MVEEGNMKRDILQQNKKSSNQAAHHFNGIYALPSYGTLSK